ncbi:Probable sulfate transporter 3.3, partial [Striga hermonthica]
EINPNKTSALINKTNIVFETFVRSDGCRSLKIRMDHIKRFVIVCSGRQKWEPARRCSSWSFSANLWPAAARRSHMPLTLLKYSLILVLPFLRVCNSSLSCICLARLWLAKLVFRVSQISLELFRPTVDISTFSDKEDKSHDAISWSCFTQFKKALLIDGSFVSGSVMILYGMAVSPVRYPSSPYPLMEVRICSRLKLFVMDVIMQSMRKPKLFWVSAGAPLLSVIISTLLVFAFRAQNHGISVIGKLQEGLNPPSWNMLHFHGNYLGLVIRTGLVTGIISLTEGIAVGRTFAALKNYQVDGNKEMIAIGLMNIVGSTTSCYVTTGAFSRSAVNHNAGCKTALSNIIMAVTVMVTLLFLMPLFQYTPNVVLGAIIVTAVVGLIDFPAACQIWKVDKFDFLVMLCAFFGVLFISVQDGLAIAVGISIFKILLQITRPKTVMLGNIPGTDIYRNLDQYKETVSVPKFLILSIEAPINFANTTYLKERITRWIEEYKSSPEDENGKKKAELKFVVLDLSAVSAIDTNGVAFFKDLRMTMEKKHLELVLVNPLGEVIEKLQRADNAKEYERADCLFLTVGEAVSFHLQNVKSFV